MSWIRQSVSGESAHAWKRFDSEKCSDDFRSLADELCFKHRNQINETRRSARLAKLAQVARSSHSQRKEESTKSSSIALGSAVLGQHGRHSAASLVDQAIYGELGGPTYPLICTHERGKNRWTDKLFAHFLRPSSEVHPDGSEPGTRNGCGAVLGGRQGLSRKRWPICFSRTFPTTRFGARRYKRNSLNGNID